MAEENTRAVKILLVEDHPGDVRLLKEFLQELALPMKLYAVERGELALAFLYNEGRYAQAPSPDVIFLDLDLPGREGLQVLEAIQNDPAVRAIPVVLFSSGDSKKEQLVAAGVVAAYLTHSLEQAQYMKLLEKLRGPHTREYPMDNCRMSLPPGKLS